MKPIISEAQFAKLKKDIAASKNREHFDGCAECIKCFTVDNNIIGLAGYFNLIAVRLHMESTIDLFDVSDMTMRLTLEIAANKAKQYSFAKRHLDFSCSFSFNKYYYTVLDLLFKQKDSSHFVSYCCDFYTNIHCRLISFHPKLRGALPDEINNIVNAHLSEEAYSP